MLMILGRKRDFFVVTRVGWGCRRHLNKLKRKLHSLTPRWLVKTITLHPIQRLDEGAADVRFVDDQQTVLRDQSCVDWPGLGTDPVAPKEQPRPRLIDRAANNHRLEQ